MIKTINTLFVTMLGLGKVPKIPGTFGSLATVIILYLFFHIFNLSSNFILILLILNIIYPISCCFSAAKREKMNFFYIKIWIIGFMDR